MTRSVAATSTLDRIDAIPHAPVGIARRSRPTKPDRVDLVVIGRRWVAIHTGPHALAVMETSPDRTCMLDTPFASSLSAVDVIDWQRHRVPPGTIITAEPQKEPTS